MSQTFLVCGQITRTMGIAPCLYSRGRPGKLASKRLRGFLSLPGELRDQVYGYYFEAEFRCEVAAESSRFEERKPRIVKLWAGIFQSDSQALKYDPEVKEEGPATIRISRPLGKYNIIKGMQTNWFTSLFAINLVCKQIHVETLPFLYRQTLFVFDAPGRIRNFLDVVSKSKLEYITRLQLHYSTYGSPSWNKDYIWQEKHARSWTRALTEASKRFMGLQNLKIWVRVNDYSPRFNLREPWVLPLLQFRRLTCASKTAEGCTNGGTDGTRQKTLDVVIIDFRTCVFGWQFDGHQELAKASEALHRLFGRALSSAILGAKEEAAMADFNEAWNGKYKMWQYHLGFGKTRW